MHYLACGRQRRSYASVHCIKRIHTMLFADAGPCMDVKPVDSPFRRILNNESHVLHQLLPEKTNCTYNLRSRQHDRQLTRKSTHISDSLFFVRMLYKDAY